MDKIEVLFSEEEIEKKLNELARKIEEDYNGKEITVICVLKGATFFTIELTKRIKNKMQFEFIELSSYGNNTESLGNIRVVKDLNKDIENKDILIIEDIIDTGRTMKHLIKELKRKNAKSIKIATLLDKKERRLVDLDANYVGFEIPNKFVVGYGMDYAENYRNLPYIGYIKQ